MQWETVDVTQDALVEVFDSADAVIHLAWLFQPTHGPVTTWRTNVLGSIRVFEAAAQAGVPALVYASSVGAYSPRHGSEPTDETWPTHGWPAAAYTREKAYLERYLDAFEHRNPATRVVRLRPAFMFKRESASQQRRLFPGPLLPNQLARPDLLPVVPNLPGLRFQALHTTDAAEAFRLAVTSPARGAFNLAGDSTIDADMLAAMFGARTLPVPAWPVRAGLSLAWHAHLVPASPDLFDAVLRLPIMDTSRARAELDWTPAHTGQEALRDFFHGLHSRQGRATPPLQPELPGGRTEELRTGVGGRP